MTRREFVAYNDADDVVARRDARPGEPLETFAAEHPDNEVAEVVNSREVRTIFAAEGR